MIHVIQQQQKQQCSKADHKVHTRCNSGHLLSFLCGEFASSLSSSCREFGVEGKCDVFVVVVVCCALHILPLSFSLLFFLCWFEEAYWPQWLHDHSDGH